MHLMDFFNRKQQASEGEVIPMVKDPFERWKKSVTMTHPDVAQKILFLSKNQGNTIVATDPTTKITYGSFDVETMRGQVRDAGVAEGSEQVYKVLAVDKSNALSKQVKLKVKASSLDEVFERLAINDWYPLEINGVEVIAGKRLKQGVAEALKPEAMASLNKAKEVIAKNREADVAAWEQDFKKNFAAKRGSPPPAAPIAQPQPMEKHSVLKSRMAGLEQAIQKQKYLDYLTFKAEQKGLQNIQANIDTSLYVRDGANDNYQALNAKLDKAIEYIRNRLGITKLAFKKPKAVVEGDKEQKPKIRKYSKLLADGSKTVRYEVLDYKGRRVSGQGPEGFDDLKNAKQFFQRNKFKLSAPVEESGYTGPNGPVDIDKSEFDRTTVKRKGWSNVSTGRAAERTQFYATEPVATPSKFDDEENIPYNDYDDRKPIGMQEELNPVDTIRMDIPLLLRVMEFAKEDAKTDMDLHVVAEKLIELGKTGDTLTMQDYQNAVAAVQRTTESAMKETAGGRYWCSTDKRWKDGPKPE